MRFTSWIYTFWILQKNFKNGVDLHWFSVESRVNQMLILVHITLKWSFSQCLQTSKGNCLRGPWLHISLVMYTRFKHSLIPEFSWWWGDTASLEHFYCAVETICAGMYALMSVGEGERRWDWWLSVVWEAGYSSRLSEEAAEKQLDQWVIWTEKPLAKLISFQHRGINTTKSFQAAL